ncbi:MAG: hypothetical protein JJT81_16560 [Rubellimicrobium sp.]|nr:hypothetical protein [Rubellimicrobium sp.]
MIAPQSANFLLNLISGETVDPRNLNQDYAWHLRTLPTPERDPWPMRLLPGFLRKPLKARIEARRYEQSLIALWETSPHLLDDIGVAVSTDVNLSDSVILAPAEVIAHVTSANNAKAAPAPQAQPKALRKAKVTPVKPLPTGVAANGKAQAVSEHDSVVVPSVRRPLIDNVPAREASSV